MLIRLFGCSAGHDLESQPASRNVAGMPVRDSPLSPRDGGDAIKSSGAMTLDKKLSSTKGEK